MFSHGAAMLFQRFRGKTSIPALALAACLYVASAAQAAAITLLRDPDIEHALLQLSAPILTAAGLSPRRVRVVLVDDSSLNAFVIDHRTIFIHRGLVLKVDSARELQAVIAHEAAHIANGHIARRMANFRSASTAAGLGMALAVAAAAAGGGQAAAGIGLAAQSAAQRSFLAHTRAEESSADQSAAQFLRRAGISPRGLLEVQQIFRGQEALNVSRQDPYIQSHPLTRDRIRAAEAFVAAYGDEAAPRPNDDYWFARARGKLSAFTRSPKWTERRVSSETFKDVRLMREAVAAHRERDLARARQKIDAAIALRPKDGYYYDLKGQILLESRRATEAIAAYRTASELAPGEPLILGGYGRALLANKQYRPALEQLERARARDFRDTRVLRDMSIAYAQLGQTGMASVVTAERYALQGRLSDAGIHAQRAMRQLPQGSPPWQRAQDVFIAAEKAEKKR